MVKLDKTSVNNFYVGYKILISREYFTSLICFPPTEDVSEDAQYENA